MIMITVVKKKREDGTLGGATEERTRWMRRDMMLYVGKGTEG